MPTHAIERRAMRTWPTATAFAILSLWAGVAATQPRDDGANSEGPRLGPPPEALAACSSLAAGRECSVTLGSNTVKGTCWAPEGKPLACRPAGASAPQGGKPPASGK